MSVHSDLWECLPYVLAWHQVLRTSYRYASVIATQLAQTLDTGWAEGRLTPTVLSAVVGSVGVLLATFTVPPVRDFLGLILPSPFGWTLIGGGAVFAVLFSRVLVSLSFTRLAIREQYSVLSTLARPKFERIPPL